MFRKFSLEQEDDYYKYFNLFFVKQYWSVKKLINLTQGKIAERRRSVRMSHMPYLIYLDPTNACNLRCPVCPTGINENGRNQGFMDFSTCKSIVDELKGYLFFVRLYNWGESLLNKDIFKMIDYIQQQQVGTAISTNLNVDENIIEKIGRSSLDYLIVSLDGITQKSYEQYRVKGNIKKVMTNLKNLISLNKELGNTNLVVEWLFVVNKFNQDEVKDAEDIAKEIGVDVLHFVPIMDSVSASKMNNKGAEIYNKFSLNHQFTPSKANFCSWHYSRMVFNWDGKVSPCCILDDKDTDFGDLISQNVGEIWNNTTYRETRQMFRDNAQNEHPDHICSRCTYY